MALTQPDGPAGSLVNGFWEPSSSTANGEPGSGGGGGGGRSDSDPNVDPFNTTAKSPAFNEKPPKH